MKVFLDLHIHSVLSPCADFLMTADNIISKLKEEKIKVFSITDHNSSKNSLMFQEKAKKEGLLFIPGMEVQTAEEIHILSYFKNMQDLDNFSNAIYKSLSSVKNNEEIYGYQLIIDENDEYIEKEEAFLAGSSKYGIDELIKIIKENNGIAIPAHMDRSSSVISNLGYIPEINFDAFEIYNTLKIENLKNKYSINKPIISSSDSHYLEMIKAKMYVEIENLNIDEIFNAILNNKIRVII